MSLFRKICYTNENKGDFTAESLPRTRWGVFRDAFRHKFTTLVAANGLFLLFAIPLIAVLFFGNVYGSAYLSNAMEEGGSRFQEFYNAYHIMFLALIPAVAVAGIGGGGLMYTLRDLAWRECAFVARTFFTGIRKSIKQTSAGFALLGAFIYALFTLISYATAWGSAGLAVICVAAVFALFIFSAYVFYLPQAVLYDCGTLTILRNCVILALSRLPSACGIFLLLFATNILLGFVGMVGQFICILYDLVFGVALGGLAATLYAHSVFDKTLNKPFPEIIGKGLYKETSEKEELSEETENSELSGEPAVLPVVGNIQEKE